MYFYLGTHIPSWLNRSHVPLFVSAVRMPKRKLPRARVPWAVDSGGFSVLSGSKDWPGGSYPWSPSEYAGMVRRWRDEVGNLDWAAVQDWMCEEKILRRTGLTVAEHQRRTVRSAVELRDIAPDLPWVPVLQGFTRDDYFRCVDLYGRAGVDLFNGRTVGIGSVCRREDTREAEQIIRELAGLGLRLHGFGFKLGGVERCADVLASADSLAWSDGERHKANKLRKHIDRHARTPSLFGCEPVTVKSRANDPAAALEWLADVRFRAGVTSEGGTTCCPFCQSSDVHPPMSSDLDYCCVECGSAWGDVRDPDLLAPEWSAR